MDQPICYSRSHVINMESPDDCFRSRLQLYRDHDYSALDALPTFEWMKQEDLCERIRSSIDRDDKDAFLRLLKDPKFEYETATIYGGFSSFAKERVFDSDAVNIAIAVLNGETKGIIEFQDVIDGVTLLHLAAYYGAPKITKYLLQRGDNVDVICDYLRLNLKQATPLDVAIESSTTHSYETPDNPLFTMLGRFFLRRKQNLEAIRLLVQHSENKERVRQAFISYAHKGQLGHLVVLFLAVPELFVLPYMAPLGIVLSPFSTLCLEVNSLENKTDIQEGLSLLLDVFAVIGDKLVAYIRLEETREENIYKIEMGIDFFLREAAAKKLGVSTPDYYFRFFQPLIPKAIDGRIEGYVRAFHECTFALTMSMWYNTFAYLVERKDFDKADLFRLLPKIDDKIVGRLDRAIKKKLASLSTLHECFETLAKVSNGKEKHHPLQLLFPYGKTLERSLIKPVFAYKSTLTKEVMKTQYAYKSTLTNEAMTPEKSTLTNEVIRTKLKSLFSTRGLYNIAKRVIK